MNEDDRQVNCLEKLTWGSADEATAAAIYAKWQYGSDSPRPRPYSCRYCHKWHLASAREE